MKDIKQSYPVDLADFAIQKGIAEEPAFAWWVGNILKTRNRIIEKVKSRYWKQEYKFGIRLPKNVEDAIRLDQYNGNYFWQDAIQK